MREDDKFNNGLFKKQKNLHQSRCFLKNSVEYLFSLIIDELTEIVQDEVIWYIITDDVVLMNKSI